MSAALEIRAEKLKLARLLELDSSELGYLDQLQPGALRELRGRTSDAIFDADRRMAARLATGAGLLPAGLVATIGQRALGPKLCVTVAGRVDPEKATEIAASMERKFLADVSVELDPRRARGMLAAMPPEQSAAVAAVLVERGEHVAMGRFVGNLGAEALAACLEVIASLATTSVEAGLWAELAPLVPQLDESAQRIVARAIGGLDEPTLRELITTAAERELWPSLVEVATRIDPEAQAEIAALVGETDPNLLRSLLEAIETAQMWDELIEIAERMDPAHRARLFEAARAAELADRLASLYSP